MHPYINKGLKALDKAADIVQMYGGVFIRRPASFSEVPEGKALICVMRNSDFDAALFVYNEREFAAATRPGDDRCKQWLLIDWDKACELTEYQP